MFKEKKQGEKSLKIFGGKRSLEIFRKKGGGAVDKHFFLGFLGFFC